MGLLISSSGRHPQWGLLAVRLTVGVVMVVAGYMKLFEFGVPLFAESLATEGVPLPAVFAWGVTLLELVGGAFLILGLLARPIALLLAIDMVVAMFLVSLEIGFLSPTGKAGAEINVILIGSLLATLFAGAGSISLDRVLEGGARAREAGSGAPGQRGG
jgi:putative oxidoreductase